MKQSEFTGKKLLYLGGISRARFVVERARKLGAYVIVADYNRDSPAKLVANEAVLIDAMDVGALVKLCKEKSVNGVMTGYCDILLPICKAVSEQIGIPCYYTENMLRFATDKAYFKEVCRKYHVPVPESYFIDEREMESSARNLTYPVFIKPMDASGSRGANACYSKNEFHSKYFFAKDNSKSGRVSVEECLTGTAFILDYMLCDGAAKLLSMADCYARPGRSAAVNSPDLMILPSKFLNRYLAKVDSCVKSLFQGENYENGLMFFQGYAKDDGITFYESGCRLGGTWPYIDEYHYGVNPMDMLFRHALSGSMDSPSHDAFSKIAADFNGAKSAIIYFLANRSEGQIAKVEGVEEVSAQEWVVHSMQYYFPEDKFDSLRQTDVRFLAVHIVAANMGQLKERIQFVYSKIKFLDFEGKSLLAPAYDVSSLCGYVD